MINLDKLNAKIISVKSNATFTIEKINNDFQITQIDDEILSTLGIPRELIMNTPMSSVFPKHIYEERKQIMDSVLLGRNVSVELKDENSFFYWQTDLLSKTIDNKNVIIGVFKNITKEKSTNKGLLSSIDNFKSIEKSIPGALLQFEYHFDDTITLKYFSKKAQKILDGDITNWSDFKENILNYEIFLNHIKDSIKHSTQINYTGEFLKDGIKTWWSLNASPIRTNKNSILFNGILENTTEYIQVLEENNKRKNFLDELLNLAPIGISVMNIHTREYLYMGSGFPKIMGMSSEEYLNKGFSYTLSRIHRDDLQNCLDSYDEMIEYYNSDEYIKKQKEKIASVEYRIQDIHNKWKWVKTIATIFKPNLNKKNDEIIQLSIDITNEKKASEELQKNEILLMQSSKMAEVGQMAGCIAHEINNPLTILSQIIEQLKDNTDLNNKNIANAEETLERINLIIKSLLSFAKDDSSLPKHNDSVHKIIDKTLLLCQNRFLNDDISIDIDGDDFDLFCHSNQISQVILNLLNNAFDAISSNQKENKWVKIYTELSGNNKIIRLQDSGMNIDFEKIFNPFFTTKENGTGLGLTICEMILSKHNASISLNSNSKNTEFVIEFKN